MNLMLILIPILVSITVVTTMVPDSHAMRLARAARAAAKTAARRFHTCRHTAATLPLALGFDLFMVKETLGHSQITLTADLYGHLTPRIQREAANKIGELLGDV